MLLCLRSGRVVRSSGNSVSVDNGFGVIEFGEKQIDTNLEYTNSPAEVAAFLAVPKVLKRGIEINRHDDHKSRGFSTVTFADSVQINGKNENMAVVVKRLGRNLYKTHRILVPDGSAFIYETKKQNLHLLGALPTARMPNASVLLIPLYPKILGISIEIR